MDVLAMIRICRPKPDSWKGEPYKWVEIKYDGIRVLIHKDANSVIRAVCKKWYINIWPKLKHNKELLLAVNSMPPDSIVEGEAHNWKSNAEMSTILATKGKFEFRAFALPAIAGRLFIQEEIEIVRARLQEYNFLVPEILPLWPRLNREQLLEEVRSRKIEGFVLKISHYRTWFKLKIPLEADGIVTGTKPGTKQHKGKVGSMEVSVYKDGILTPVANVGSLTQKLRDEVTKMGDDLFGRVLEFEHEGFLVDLCKFPRFSRWREDKPAEECTFQGLLDGQYK